MTEALLRFPSSSSSPSRQRREGAGWAREEQLQWRPPSSQEQEGPSSCGGSAWREEMGQRCLPGPPPPPICLPSSLCSSHRRRHLQFRKLTFRKLTLFCAPVPPPPPPCLPLTVPQLGAPHPLLSPEDTHVSPAIRGSVSPHSGVFLQHPDPFLLRPSHHLALCFPLFLPPAQGRLLCPLNLQWAPTPTVICSLHHLARPQASSQPSLLHLPSSPPTPGPPALFRQFLL